MGWEALTAISVTVLAATVVAAGLVLSFWVRDFGRLLTRLESLTQLLDREAGPLLRSARSVADDARTVVATVRAEVEQIVRTSRSVRERVSGAAGAVENRAKDLEAVLDVLQEEVEETALDVAAALRATRRGVSLVGAIKRAVLRGRR